MHGGVGAMYALAHVWRSEDHFKELGLLFHPDVYACDQYFDIYQCLIDRFLFFVF